MTTTKKPIMHVAGTGAVLPAYSGHFGLSRMPFPVTPDDSRVFFTRSMREIFAEFLHFLELKKGFLLLTGDVGLGKTTFVRHMLGKLERNTYRTAFLFSSFLDQEELLQAITADFGIEVKGEGCAAHLAALNRFLLERNGEGKTCVLVVDDAQALDGRTLDVIRQLSNLETAEQKLIQIVMVGQPELLKALEAHDLRQLTSRIALHRELKPLQLDELDAYLHYRMRLAGNPDAFEMSPAALDILYGETGGIPRRVHHVMDRCLFAMAAAGSRVLEPGFVRSALSEMNSTSADRRTRLSSSLLRRAPWLMVPAGIALGLFVVISLTVGSPAKLRQEQAAGSAASPRQAEWERFVQAYAGLERLPLEKWESRPELQHALDRIAGAGRFVPVFLEDESQTSCEGKPVWRLQAGAGEARGLTFIQTELPVTEMPFGEAADAVKKAQQMLAAKGWMPKGAVDGRMGAGTAHAISRYQRARSMKGTGQFSPELAYAIGCEFAASAKR